MLDLKLCVSPAKHIKRKRIRYNEKKFVHLLIIFQSLPHYLTTDLDPNGSCTAKIIEFLKI
jgi:hypothetical protein